MKIALLSEKYTPDIGGLAISTERFARLLSSAGYDVRVFCPSLNLPPSEQRTLISNGNHVTRFGVHKRADDSLVDWFELITQEHQREPFDVLHAYFLTQAGFVAAYAGKYLNIPSIVSIRGNDIERAAFDPSKFSHVMYALQHASAVTTNASELMKKAKALIDREIFLIPNGVDAEHFKPMERNETLAETLKLTRNVTLSDSEGSLTSTYETLRSQQTLPQSDILPVIGFVGELREKKGLAALLSAHALVNKQKSVTLLIIGKIREGEDRKRFDEFRMANPQLPLIVTGYVAPKELPAYYSLIDVFVHPSLRDGMPNAVLEAMACGKAVVATAVGGVAQAIKDGETGAIVPANDAEVLSNAILRLLNDPSLRSRLGKAARQRVVEDFTLEKELNGNLDVYRRLGLNP